MNNIDAIQILSSYGVPQNEEEFREALDMAIEALSAPTCPYYDTEIKTCRRSEVPRKHGEWIRHFWGFECNKCHESIEGGWDRETDSMKPFSNFCPNCGADMKKGGEK